MSVIHSLYSFTMIWFCYLSWVYCLDGTVLCRGTLSPPVHSLDQEVRTHEQETFQEDNYVVLISCVKVFSIPLCRITAKLAESPARNCTTRVAYSPSQEVQLFSLLASLGRGFNWENEFVFFRHVYWSVQSWKKHLKHVRKEPRIKGSKILSSYKCL